MRDRSPFWRNPRLLVPLTFLLGGVAWVWVVRPMGQSEELRGPLPEMIWDSAWPREPIRAHSFSVEREFEAPEVPSTARILMVADEAYHLFVNDRWVGSGGAHDLSTWDSWAAAPSVRVGTNKIRIRLRSGRGVGGLLFCLQADVGDRCWVRSDESWTVVPADGADPHPVVVWGAPPVGNWVLPGAVRDRHRVVECFDLDRPIEANRAFDLGTRTVRDGGEDLEMPVGTVRWGLRRRGLVEIDVDPSARQVGEIAYGRQRRQSAERRNTELLVTEPGQSSFRSVTAREFRFVEIDGLPGVTGGRYYRLRPRCDDWLFEAPAAPRGLAGLEPPPSRSPVEDELRGEL